MTVGFVKSSYPEGVCPDCGEAISILAYEGDACKNCGHVFWVETPDFCDEAPMTTSNDDPFNVLRSVPEDRLRDVFDFCVAERLWVRFVPLFDNVWEIAVRLTDRAKLQEFFSE